MTNNKLKTAGKLPDIESDSPTTKDKLGFKRFVDFVANIIFHSTNENTPLTIGVYGEWGSGKTSFLRMVDDALQKQGISTVWFNAWKYNQEDNLWAALIQTILNMKIRGGWYRRLGVRFKLWLDKFNLRSGIWEVARRLVFIVLQSAIVVGCFIVVFGWSLSEITTFLNQVLPQWFKSSPITLSSFQIVVIKSLTGLVGFLTLNPSELFRLFNPKLGINFSKFQRARNYRDHIAFLDEFGEEFKGIIQLVSHGKPLVVIIDDLDRCLPEKAIQVLEAIKLFLDVSGCVFLLAVDRDVVEKAITVKYKDLLTITEGVNAQTQQMFAFFGENYFEKIVQLPFTLPPISSQQLEDFIVSLCPNDDDVKLCSRIFSRGLPHNPRKVKRLLLAFIFLRDLAIDDIKQGLIKPTILAKMVIIQSQFRRVYEDLYEVPTLLAELEAICRNKKRVESIDTPLRDKVNAAYQHISLQRMLYQQVKDDDTFMDVNLERYIFLLKPVVEANQLVTETPKPASSTTVKPITTKKENNAKKSPISLKGYTEEERTFLRNYSSDDEWDVKRANELLGREAGET